MIPPETQAAELPEAKAPRPTKQAMLVILRSATDRGPWTIVKPEDVPAWLKDEDCMARLMEGEMCAHNTAGPNGGATDWYRAQPARAEDVTAMLDAQAKRERRALKRATAERRIATIQ